MLGAADQRECDRIHISQGTQTISDAVMCAVSDDRGAGLCGDTQWGVCLGVCWGEGSTH